MAMSLRRKVRNKRKSPSLSKVLASQIDKMAKYLDVSNTDKIIKHLHDQGKLEGIANELGINIDTSVRMLNSSAVPCGSCAHAVDSDTDGVSCHICGNWYHYGKCSNVDETYKDLLENDNIWYVCSACKNHDASQQKASANTKKIEDKLDELLAHSQAMSGIIHDTANVTREVADNLGDMENKINEVDKTVSGKKTATYANVTKKNILVVKSTDNTQKASDMKADISSALVGLQIVNTQFKPTGNVVLNFKTEHERDQAAMKVDQLNNLSTKPKQKRLPRIMICNVSTVENKDNLIETIIDRNDYLKTITDIGHKINLIYDKKAKGGTIHYVLKCDPEVRGLIHKNGDAIKLEWGVYNVRDRYRATMCFHCLKYGHIQDKCTDAGSDPHCQKCAGNHSSNYCSVSVKKCLNCVRAGKSDINHSAGEICCPVLNAEIARLRNITDHGY